MANTANLIQGTCFSMCSNEESRLRQKENLIHVLEMKINAKGERTIFCDNRRMIKRFSRPAAGLTIKASYLRPLPVLQKTVNYIFANVCTTEDVSFRQIYDFVSDRLRAIRQDLCVQGLLNKDAVSILAPMARFHLYSNFMLCEYETSEFDAVLNIQLLDDILLTLIQIFRDHNFTLATQTIDYKNKGSNSEEFSQEQTDIFTGNTERIFNLGDERQNQDSINVGTSTSDFSNNILHPYSNINKNSDISTDEDATIDKSLTSFQHLSLNDRNSPGGHGDMPPYSNISIQSEKGYENFSKNNCSGHNKKSLSLSKYSVLEEIISFYVLVHIGDTDVLRVIYDIPQSLRKSDLVSSVIQASLSWSSGNHVPLVRLYRRLTPILCMAVHLHLHRIQRHALGILSVGHSSKALTYNVEDLQKHLLFSSSESLIKACQHYGLSATSSGVTFEKSVFDWNVKSATPEKCRWIEDSCKQFSVVDMLLT